MRYLKKIKYRKVYSFLFFYFFFAGLQCYPGISVDPDASAVKEKLRSVADAVLKNAAFDFTDEVSGKHYTSALNAPAGSVLKLGSSYNAWRYWNGILNIAMIKLGKVLNNHAYTDFAVNNIAFSFKNYKYFKSRYKGEDKWSYPFAQHFIMEELDDYGAMGASLIEVYQIDKKEEYKKYIDKAADYILNGQQRFSDGSYIRSFPRKWTLWADDLYMSISFLSRMGSLTGDSRYFDDAAEQVINYNKRLFDTEKGLMYHNWYSDVNKHGVAFWGRANGWALLAQIDLLCRLPKSNAYRDTLLSLFKRHINGVIKYQNSSGLWRQLIDKNDSYLETSCSAMFTYVIARAVNIGILPKSYASFAKLGWQGILTKIGTDGKIEGVCTGTVVSDDLGYYYRRPTPLNDLHGLGTVLLAGAEVCRL